MNKAQKKPLQLQDSLAVRILICVLFPLIAFAGLLLSQGKYIILFDEGTGRRVNRRLWRIRPSLHLFLVRLTALAK